MAWNFNSAIDQTAQLAKVHLRETPSKGKAVSLYACSMIAIWDNSCKFYGLCDFNVIPLTKQQV